MVNDQTILPTSGLTQPEWDALMTCMKDLFAPYAVDVVDVEPPCGPEDPPFIESIVGGDINNVHWRSPPITGTIGISPMNGDCSVVEQSITFNFSDTVKQYNLSAHFLCGVVAQETAHSLGLDHQMDCSQPMSYLDECSPGWEFKDADFNCGEYSPRACKCVGNTQNNHQVLESVLGPADAVPPTVTITEPAEGAEVEFGFEIVATAEDNTRINRVAFFVDDERFGIDQDKGYRLPSPLALSVGQHVIKVVSYDGDENTAEDTRTITIKAQCSVDADCAQSGASCDAGRCMAGLGTPCENHEECASGVCYVDKTKDISVCSQTCEVGGDSCGNGTSCQEVTQGPAKCLPGGGDSGGCAVGTPGRLGGGLASGLLVLGSLVSFAALRRSRRRRAN